MGFQRRLCLTIRLGMVSSLRIQAVRATFLGLPGVRLRFFCGGWIRLLERTNQKRIGHGAEILRTIFGSVLREPQDERMVPDD